MIYLIQFVETLGTMALGWMALFTVAVLVGTVLKAMNK